MNILLKLVTYSYCLHSVILKKHLPYLLTEQAGSTHSATRYDHVDNMAFLNSYNQAG